MLSVNDYPFRFFIAPPSVIKQRAQISVKSFEQSRSTLMNFINNIFFFIFFRMIFFNHRLATPRVCKCTAACILVLL